MPSNRPESLFRPHPGNVFFRRCFPLFRLKQGAIAQIIGISPTQLSRFIHGHMHVDTKLARKLQACTNISAKAWLHYQVEYDLYKNKR